MKVIQISSLLIVAFLCAAECAYFGITSTNSYRESEKICQSQGGVLASFHSDTEYDYAEAVCESLCDTYDALSSRCGCWIGLLDWGQGDNFKWQDRSEKDYVMSSSGKAYVGVDPWFAGEPDNYDGVDMDCVRIWKAQGYQQSDLDCNVHSFFAVCEENTKEYFSVQSQSDYADSAKQCREEGGVLASFHDINEFTATQAICQKVCETLDASNTDCGCWVGLQDLREEDDWHWEDQSFKDFVMLRTGHPVTGFPWYTDEPNNLDDEDCVHMWREQGYLLNDMDCEDTNYAVCTRYVPNRLPEVPEEEEEKEEVLVVRSDSIMSAALDSHFGQIGVVVMVGVPVLLVSSALVYLCMKSQQRDERKSLLSEV